MTKRFFAGIVVCLGVALGIAWFEGLNLGAEQINQAFEDPNLRTTLSKSTLSYLLIPYSLYNNAGAIVPIFAWAAGGFIAGLINKSPTKGFLIGITSVGIAWLLFSYLSGTLADLSFEESLTALVRHAEGVEKDLACAGIASAIPGYLGGRITEDQGMRVIPMPKDSIGAN